MDRTRTPFTLVVIPQEPSRVPWKTVPLDDAGRPVPPEADEPRLELVRRMTDDEVEAEITRIQQKPMNRKHPTL